MGKVKISELKEIIIKNPTLPIKFFASGDCNGGVFGYEECFISSISVDEIALYDYKWLNEEDLRERLEWCLYNDGISENELKAKIDTILSNTNFEKIICVFLG